MMEQKRSWWLRRRRQERIYGTVVFIVISLGAVVFMIPLAWMVSTALKSLPEIYHFPPQLIPETIVWRNFIDAFTASLLPFGIYFRNSAIITFSCMIGGLVSTSLVGFGFSRLRAPGRNLLFMLVLVTMMVPQQVTMIPMYTLFVKLGWIDTYKPLIIPYFFGIQAFFIFLYRQFFMGIPSELDNAARIDGCGTFGIYLRIMLPLSKPVLATVAIFSFVWRWNDFMNPLIYLNTMEKYTVPLGLQFFFGYYGQVEWHYIMVVSIILLLPCMLIFFFAQKYFIKGIVMTGLK